MEEQKLFDQLDHEIEVLREARRQGIPLPNVEKIHDICRELAALPDVETFPSRKAAMPEMEREDIKHSIKFFEEKYGGSYHSTLMLKENKNHRELSDEDEWKYMIGRLNDELGDR